MHCEVCGRRITYQSRHVVIEGAEMLVCNECARLGSVTWKSRAEPKLRKVTRRSPAPAFQPRKQPLSRALSVVENVELMEDFGVKVRQAREKFGISHEELGKRIGEKVSVLKKVENEKMVPNRLLVEKLQYALHIKLLVPTSEPKVPSKALTSRPLTTTLGDILTVKRDKDEKE